MSSQATTSTVAPRIPNEAEIQTFINRLIELSDQDVRTVCLIAEQNDLDIWTTLSSITPRTLAYQTDLIYHTINAARLAALRICWDRNTWAHGGAAWAAAMALCLREEITSVQLKILYHPWQSVIPLESLTNPIPTLHAEPASNTSPFESATSATREQSQSHSLQ